MLTNLQYRHRAETAATGGGALKQRQWSKQRPQRRHAETAAAVETAASAAAHSRALAPDASGQLHVCAAHVRCEKKYINEMTDPLEIWSLDEHGLRTNSCPIPIRVPSKCQRGQHDAVKKLKHSPQTDRQDMLPTPPGAPPMQTTESADRSAKIHVSGLKLRLQIDASVP